MVGLELAPVRERPRSERPWRGKKNDRWRERDRERENEREREVRVRESQKERKRGRKEGMKQNKRVQNTKTR